MPTVVHRKTLVAIAVLVLALLVPGHASAAPPPALPKGPVGWDTYRTMSALAQLRPGAQLKQFSSFDRTGNNDDGFNGTYSCLRQDDEGCVIAESLAPGEISSIWFTYASNSVAPIGRITVELDGRTVLSGSLQDIVDGKRGAPFVWPLVGNSADTMGGAVIKVPMPHTHSMRVTTEHNPHFYHVAYRQFADATGVRTFDPTDKATDVLQRLRGYGVRDPKPAAPGARTQHTAVALAPGAAVTLPVNGPGRIDQLALRLPQVVAAPAVYDDGRAFAQGGSSFAASISPANDGIRITRRYDAGIGQQRASVTVDGQQAGEWDSGAAAPGGRWAEQTIDVPAALTAHRSSVRIASTFVSSALDVNEFRYEIHSKIGGEWVRTDIMDVGPNHPSDEAVHGYRITGQTWAGLQNFRYATDAGQVAASDAVLDGLRLRITFDGQTTVDAPVGEFFGSGLGKYASRTLLHSIDTTEDGAFTSWWPMPYRQRAVVELVNTSQVPVGAGDLAVTAAPDGSVSNGLTRGELGYFHATQHRGDTVTGQDWNFLNTQGRGLFYGVTTTMRGHIPPGPVHQMNFLEGDERVYPDGTPSPVEYGTGSEDFYESGWYFQDARDGGVEGVPYAMPQAGLVSHENGTDGCQYVCLNAYRLMIGDAVPFGAGVEFDIEHGDRSQMPADYSSTAYWYGQAQPSLKQSDVIDLADDGSRLDHGYSAPGETRTALTSTFEGKADRAPVDGTVATTTGTVTFTARVDQGNQGVRLRRLSDQSKAFQHAAVFVDGQPAGEWYQPLGNTYSRWLEDSFDLPPALTAGRSSVEVRLEPVVGAPAWSGARYSVFSHTLTPPAD
ncbi:glycoside hydrolase family 172 protein [Amycolatopsis sacchari]|uniref:glycoside hydrolase family 172 protein n=1 Tax=Amycolatopsis sacchari TaxID=115433 RepID=UPI003D702811